MKPHNIPTLDGWRAVAIIMVIVCHLMPSTNSDWMWCGATGVDIFFGLSGFLITRLLLQEHDRTGQISLRGFYHRRVFRILPPMFAFLIVIALSGLFRSKLEVASTLLFFRNYLPDDGTTFTRQLWSLSVEEHFYLIWPGLLILLGIPRTKNLVGYFAFGIALWRLVAPTMLWANVTGISPSLRTDFRLDSLLWGCVVAFILQDKASKSKLTSTLRPLAWILIVSAIIAPHFVYRIPILEPFMLIGTFVIPMLTPFVLAGTVLHPQWILSRFLEFSVMKWIGKLSYSIYLWNALFLMDGKFHTQSMCINIIIVAAVASLSYYFLELPMIRLGQTISRRRSLKEGLATIPAP
jgi:peptidoglycan/LPS O-acetylase OafA/YrhL